MEKVTEKIERGSPEVLAQIRRAVRTLNGASDPDLEQEAFMRTLEAFRRLEPIRHPRALMWKIVRNTVADHWRRRLRHRWDDVDSIPESRLAAPPTLDEDLDRKRRRESLERAIDRLAGNLRGPLYLYYFEACPIRVIARRLGKSPAAVKMALYRGRRHLERKLNPAREK